MNAEGSAGAQRRFVWSFASALSRYSGTGSPPRYRATRDRFPAIALARQHAHGTNSLEKVQAEISRLQRKVQPRPAGCEARAGAVIIGVLPDAFPRAEVAQLVEHRTENAGVPSSTLGLGTKSLRSVGPLQIPHLAARSRSPRRLPSGARLQPQALQITSRGAPLVRASVALPRFGDGPRDARLRRRRLHSTFGARCGQTRPGVALQHHRIQMEKNVRAEQHAAPIPAAPIDAAITDPLCARRGRPQSAASSPATSECCSLRTHGLLCRQAARR